MAFVTRPLNFPFRQGGPGPGNKNVMAQFLQRLSFPQNVTKMLSKSAFLGPFYGYIWI